MRLYAHLRLSMRKSEDMVNYKPPSNIYLYSLLDIANFPKIRSVYSFQASRGLRLTGPVHVLGVHYAAI